MLSIILPQPLEGEKANKTEVFLNGENVFEDVFDLIFKNHLSGHKEF